MQFTQHYKLPVSMDHIQRAKPGQYVYADNDSDEVIGFIDFVSDTHLSIMLFEPRVLPFENYSIHIASTCDWQARLLEILEDDPELAEMWHNDSFDDDFEEGVYVEGFDDGDEDNMSSQEWMELYKRHRTLN